MNKTETISTNLIRAIQWANVKSFDPEFQGFILKETAEQGFEVVIKAYSNYFDSITLIDSTDLPKDIAKALGTEYALITEDHFIYSDGLIAKTDFQFFTPKSIIEVLKNKIVYLVKKGTVQDV